MTEKKTYKTTSISDQVEYLKSAPTPSDKDSNDRYCAFGKPMREFDTVYRLDIRHHDNNCEAYLYADFDIKYSPSHGITLDFRGVIPSIQIIGTRLQPCYRALCSHNVTYLQEWGESQDLPPEDAAFIEQIIYDNE